MPLPVVPPSVPIPNQAAKRAEELLKNRERIRQELEMAGPQGVAQLSVDLKAAGMNPGVVTLIIDRIRNGELSYTTIREALTTRGLNGVTGYITAPSSTRRRVRFSKDVTKGGTRKVTSSFHTTRRWKRT